MEELDIAAITKRSIHGVLALVSRTFFLQIIAFITNVGLTIYISTFAYGVYTVVTATIALLQYVSDIGLAGALIQKKEAITQEDLATTFTIQQGLVLCSVIVALCLSRVISGFYHLDQAGYYLFVAMVISFFLSSLKTIPSIILERDLLFEKLVIPQIVEQVAFSVTILVCAIRGMGISSFTYAVLARALLGLVTMYIIAPWKPTIHFSHVTAKRLLSFGVPYQLNSFLGLLKDDLFLLLVGKILPFAQVGYIGFAQKWAFTPLRLIMDNVIRITFPSFSRLQHEKDHLAHAIEKSLFALSFLIFPSLLGLVMLAPLFIIVVPRYEKWEPALLSLGFFAVNAALSSISTPLTNALNAIGKIKVTFYFMIFWTVSTYILSLALIFMLGFNGFAIASAIIATSAVCVVKISQRYIAFSAIRAIKYPLISTIIMGMVLYGLKLFLPVNWITIIILIMVGGGFYLLTLFVLAKKQVLEDLVIIKRQFIQ